MIYCHDPRHSKPCPQPCAACEEECDRNYLTCRCGSGLPWRDLSDARGIYVARVCDACEAKVKAGYRKDIFENEDYETDEPIDYPY
jgi:hypothetical protein